MFAVAAGGLEGDVEARYLAGAGASRIAVTSTAIAASVREVDPSVRVDISELADDLADAEVEHLPMGLTLDAPSAYAVALGAYRALVKLRRALALPLSREAVSNP
jgi:hypothetical protein